jgi:hypothetical protein
MVVRNTSEYCRNYLAIDAAAVGASGANSFLPFLKGSQRRTVGALPIIGSTLALLLTSSSPSHADMGGVLGGVLGGMIVQQMQQQRPAAPVYVAPPTTVYVPTPVYQAPRMYYQ